VFQNLLNSFSYRFSYNLYWHFFGLCYTLTALTFSGTSSSLLWVRVPIEIEGEPKEAARVYNTLTASKALQGICSVQALSWLVKDNSLELSHGCVSVV
jgi:hypothetical protein